MCGNNLSSNGMVLSILWYFAVATTTQLITLVRLHLHLTLPFDGPKSNHPTQKEAWDQHVQLWLQRALAVEVQQQLWLTVTGNNIGSGGAASNSDCLWLGNGCADSLSSPQHWMCWVASCYCGWKVQARDGNDKMMPMLWWWQEDDIAVAMMPMLWCQC